MEAKEYIKVAHESFVSGHHGSSALEVILAVLPIVPGTFLASSFNSSYAHAGYARTFFIEYIFCIQPLILSFTLLSDVTLELSAVLFLLLFLRITYVQKFKNSIQYASEKDNKISYLTSSRSTVNIATIIAILAVDFHIFPRRFAKTESYGYSLMDVGAACYLFMNGITDIKKDLTSKSIRDILILSLLGFLRFASLKATNYQEHVTEYGVHCNFFFTLAAIKILSIFSVSKLSSRSRLILCIVLGVVLELTFQNGLEEWTLSEAKRNGLLAANREWFVSLAGNILIYLLGMCTGEIIFCKQSKLDNLWHVCLPLFPFLISFFLESILGIEASRRLANLTFVSWIAGFFLLFMTLFRLLESFFMESSCILMKAVNNFSLLFFLLGNLLTGIINITINTLEVKKIGSFFIINVYCFVLCFLVFHLYILRK